MLIRLSQSKIHNNRIISLWNHLREVLLLIQYVCGFEITGRNKEIFAIKYVINTAFISGI